ncbi:hypothetical protein DFQ01_101557 [Paenibacillus cellulosilyticus]|uniref:DUF951 domain-containing protein n=1 Tax=Paenibacillus cellulosilyticus TaxID=375489 RepID=A0A2V2Z4W3_9BACL|nr:DUF951 domain-containing protein [Paenibacillus cellulosilyticus]PWW08830.1 hypothetical protein DFQ01_101557 [Paenibacillus cellulosilyticus]QKS48379.1 DUF951 domain-containing protein [Paenibacillus cellulosilyticus]
MERKEFQLGDVVQMKKQHPCGTNEMEIIRMGMDIRIKCVGCQHSVLIPRAKFEKNMKKVLRSKEDGQQQNAASGSE